MTQLFEQNIELHKIQLGVLNRNLVATKGHLPIFYRVGDAERYIGNSPSISSNGTIGRGDEAGSCKFEGAERMRLPLERCALSRVGIEAARSVSELVDLWRREPCWPAHP
jgi:hypothetical protein